MVFNVGNQINGHGIPQQFHFVSVRNVPAVFNVLMLMQDQLDCEGLCTARNCV